MQMIMYIFLTLATRDQRKHVLLIEQSTSYSSFKNKLKASILYGFFKFYKFDNCRLSSMLPTQVVRRIINVTSLNKVHMIGLISLWSLSSAKSRQIVSTSNALV